MYKLFIDGMFYVAARNKGDLKDEMDKAANAGQPIDKFEVYARKAHVTYTVSESKLVID